MNETPAIALFLPSLGGGGAERVMVMVANALARHGLHVDLVLVQGVGPYLSDVRGDVRIVTLGGKRTVTSLWALMKYLRNAKPTAVLSTLDRANVITILARLFARVETRVVIRLANMLSVRYSRVRMFSSNFILALMVKTVYKFADKVVAVSEGVAKDALKFAGLSDEQVTVINNPVPLDIILEQAKATPPELAHCTQPIILGVGRLTQAKDFKTLIKAFKHVRVETDAHLIILGEGKERPSLEALIAELGLSEFVSMPGFVKNPFAYMSQASVFVLSSITEGFPNVLLEAMATGTPVVATDCEAGPSEVLMGGRYGRLVPVQDSKALATAILEELKKDARPRVDLQKRVQQWSVQSITGQYKKTLLNTN